MGSGNCSPFRGGALRAPLPLRSSSAAVAASVPGWGALRALLPLRGACRALLPLRGVGTFLRYARCCHRGRQQLCSAPKRAYPHSATAQPGNPHSATALPFAPHALFLPPLAPLRGEGEIGRWGLSVLPFATTLRPE